MNEPSLAGHSAQSYNQMELGFAAACSLHLLKCHRPFAAQFCVKAKVFKLAIERQLV